MGRALINHYYVMHLGLIQFNHNGKNSYRSFTITVVLLLLMYVPFTMVSRYVTYIVKRAFITHSFRTSLTCLWLFINSWAWRTFQFYLDFMPLVDLLFVIPLEIWRFIKGHKPYTYQPMLLFSHILSSLSCSSIGVHTYIKFTDILKNPTVHRCTFHELDPHPPWIS